MSTVKIGLFLAVWAISWIAVNRYVIAPLKAEVAQHAADLEQAREAQRVADAYAEGATRRAVELGQRIETALTGQYGGCADAPIDPALLHAVGELR